MKVYIYKITNLINNKIYIGQTINIEERWRHHREIPYRKNSKERNRPLYRAIKKYGLDNFKFEIIDEVGNLEIANEKEIYYISKFNSSIDENGYNLELGGNNGLKSDYTKEKISKAHKGYGGGSFGKRKGESYRAIRVKCLNNNKIYPSIMDCADDLFGVDTELSKKASIKISNIINPNSNKFTYKGYSFRAIDDNGDVIEKNTKPLSHGKYNKGMKIIEINSKKVFDTIQEASMFFKVSSNFIRDRVYKRVKKVGELDFRMYDKFIANEEVLTGKADDNLVPSLE